MGKTNEEVIKILESLRYYYKVEECSSIAVKIFREINERINDLIDELSPPKPKFKVGDIVINERGWVAKVKEVSLDPRAYVIMPFYQLVTGAKLCVSENEVYSYEEFIQKFDGGKC